MLDTTHENQKQTAKHNTDYSVIDVDIHEAYTSIKDLVPYLREPWKSLIASDAWKGFAQPFVYWGTGGGNRADSVPIEGGPPGSSYDMLRKQVLDAYPIKYGILTGYFYPVMMMNMQHDFAAAAASAYNDYQIAHWLDKDIRLRGSIHVAPQDPKSAVREIERMADHPQMLQVLLPIADRAYGEEFYWPIFEAAARHHLPIALHHTVYAKGALGMGQYYIERHMLLPQAMMAEVYSLICSGIFEKYPNTKIICLEGGFSWLPHLLWRADREYKSLRQEVPWLTRQPSQYVYDHIRFATQPTEDITSDQFMKVIDLIGSEDLLLFATDYPHFDFDNPLRALPNGLPIGLRNKILYGNAKSFYGF